MDDKLHRQIANLTSEPGVYLFKNSKEEVIYIGKARNLKKRVKSYFRKSGFSHPRLQALVSRIAFLDTIVVDNEVEALILESNLIKKHKPHYNVNLKDDKRYPYIKITAEMFPQVIITRRRINDGAVYLGPYTDVKNMRKLLKSLRKIFPIRSCKYPLNEKNIRERKYKLCLDYHIDRCPGPCEGLVSESEYGKMIKDVVKLLKGKTKELKEEFTREMKKYADSMQFEQAARIRDRINRIDNFFFTPPKVEGAAVEETDIIASSRSGDDGVFVVMQIRDGKVIARQHYYMNSLEGKRDEEILDMFLLKNYMSRDFIPAEVIVPSAAASLPLYVKYFKEKKNAKVEFTVPKIGGKKRLLEMVQKNANLIMADLMLQKVKKEESIHFSVSLLQKELNLEKPPLRIETFDISNIQGKFPVASMVCFFNGKPLSREYRRYHIKSKNTPDDFLMMREVLTRRYSRLLREKKVMPDLILIDGGKGQLSSAVRVLHNLGLENIDVIGLAKKMEEVFIPGRKDPIVLARNSAGLKLLMHMRDEAHRFAVTFHRKVRDKHMLHSELDDIPHVGPVTRKILFERFKSVENIAAADLEELLKTPGLNARAANAVFNYFNPDE